MSRPTFLAHQGPSDEVLDDLATAFQSYSSDPIGRDDAREMAENLHGFFGVLERWARGVSAIWGIKGRGKSATYELQSIRFDRKLWTPERAKKWLRSNKFATGMEEATG